jgi:hypothetical protein
VYEGSFYPTASPTFVVVCVLMIAILTGIRRNLNVVLICISFMAKDGEHFFFVFWPLVLSLKFFCSVHLPISSLSHRFLGDFSYLSSLYILIINPLSEV